MLKIIFLISGFLVFLNSCSETYSITEEKKIISNLDWKAFNQELFDIAKQENKLVLLNIGANWCHWCHVMEDSTYANSEVQNFLNEHFILSHEDQDSRADLFSKYRNYGWPATIIFNSNAEELLALKGYQEKSKFISFLEDVIENPIVKSSSEILSNIDEDTLNINDDSVLIARFNQLIDHQKGSLNTSKKSLNKATIDMALNLADENDSLDSWLSTSIQNSYHLLDPVWGGIYQYSTNADWNHQHFEKILRVQADYISMYVQYGFQFSDTVAISNAEKIYNYCNLFLSDNAPLFDNSQDADYITGIESSHYYSLTENERLKLGTPTVNHQQFLKENAMMSISLAKLWAATNNINYLLRAEKIIRILNRDFYQSNGLYARGIKDEGIYSLEDNVAMLEALNLAYQISGDKKYILKSEELSFAILENFEAKNGQLYSSCGDIIVEPIILPNSNYSAALAIHQTGNCLNSDTLKNSGKSIAKKIFEATFAQSEYLIPYILKSRKYFEEEPYHAVWLTNKFGNELEYSMLKKVILNLESNFVFDRINLTNMTDEQALLYGSAEANTLFMCTTNFCSSPIKSVEELERFFSNQ